MQEIACHLCGKEESKGVEDWVADGICSLSPTFMQETRDVLQLLNPNYSLFAITTIFTRPL